MVLTYASNITDLDLRLPLIEEYSRNITPRTTILVTTKVSIMILYCRWWCHYVE